MPYPRDRRARQESRDAQNRLANEWLNCPKHGGYSPNVKSRYGWTRQGCPNCARAEYEAGFKNGPQTPSASGA
jgi:hypothetical protein